jgi:tetratricopeptide (TPR) repeat protein
MILRFAPALLALALCITPSQAQVAKDSSSIEVAPAAPAPKVDPAKKRAEDFDRLFGELHKSSPGNPNATIAKIWTLWEANDSPMAELLLAQANKAMRDGAFETSEIMLNEVVGSYPEFVEALNKRAMLYYNMKRYDEALEDVQAVLDVEPRHFGALIGQASIYQAQGNVAKAAQSLREAIAVNPHLGSAKDFAVGANCYNAQHICRARRAHGHTSCNQDFIPVLCKAFTHSNFTGARHHFLN